MASMELVPKLSEAFTFVIFAIAMIAMICCRDKYLVGFLAIILVCGFYAMATAEMENRWKAEMERWKAEMEKRTDHEMEDSCRAEVENRFRDEMENKWIPDVPKLIYFFVGLVLGAIFCRSQSKPVYVLVHHPVWVLVYPIRQFLRLR